MWDKLIRGDKVLDYYETVIKYLVYSDGGEGELTGQHQI
jgi:hypothetical protein